MDLVLTPNPQPPTPNLQPPTPRWCAQALDALRGCDNLETLYLEHNPLQGNHLYTVSTLALVSSLTQLDANYITREPNP